VSLLCALQRIDAGGIDYTSTPAALTTPWASDFRYPAFCRSSPASRKTGLAPSPATNSKRPKVAPPSIGLTAAHGASACSINYAIKGYADNMTGPK
jgi:hypothetical protein